MAGKTVYGNDYRRDYRSLKRRGWTDQKIADHLGVSRRTVTRWATEERQRRGQ